MGTPWRRPPPSPPKVVAHSALNTGRQPGDSPAAFLRGVTASLSTTKALGCGLGRAPLLTCSPPKHATHACALIPTDPTRMLGPCCRVRHRAGAMGGSTAEVSAADLFMTSSYKRITTLIIRSSRGGTCIVHTRPRTTGTRAGGVTYTPPAPPSPPPLGFLRSLPHSRSLKVKQTKPPDFSLQLK